MSDAGRSSASGHNIHILGDDIRQINYPLGDYTLNHPRPVQKLSCADLSTNLLHTTSTSSSSLDTSDKLFPAGSSETLSADTDTVENVAVDVEAPSVFTGMNVFEKSRRQDLQQCVSEHKYLGLKLGAIFYGLILCIFGLLLGINVYMGAQTQIILLEMLLIYLHSVAILFVLSHFAIRDRRYRNCADFTLYNSSAQDNPCRTGAWFTRPRPGSTGQPIYINLRQQSSWFKWLYPVPNPNSRSFVSTNSLPFFMDNTSRITHFNKTLSSTRCSNTTTRMVKGFRMLLISLAICMLVRSTIMLCTTQGMRPNWNGSDTPWTTLFPPVQSTQITKAQHGLALGGTLCQTLFVIFLNQAFYSQRWLFALGMAHLWSVHVNNWVFELVTYHTEKRQIYLNNSIPSIGYPEATWSVILENAEECLSPVPGQFHMVMLCYLYSIWRKHWLRRPSKEDVVTNQENKERNRTVKWRETDTPRNDMQRETETQVSYVTPDVQNVFRHDFYDGVLFVPTQLQTTDSSF
ncbi:unnamed protein product [Dicrocoelium dendriticum]|nr:unnamed protein product [Dicrocoelium dendriticum]